MSLLSLSGAQRLTAATAAHLPASVQRPGYDREKLKPGILHLGDGAFHRCHQAEWTDDALQVAFGDWGIVGVNLRAPDIANVLGVQSGLFCRELREDGAVTRRLVGSELGHISVLDEAYDPYRLSLQAALEAAADPAIRLITMTVTEKGYCHIPATGELDVDHPDIVHDIAEPHVPRSVPGFVLEALTLRLQREVDLPAIMSCDNVPDNGATLRRAVLGLAQRVDPAIADRIAQQVHFLNTMVDRIVPATQPGDIARFAEQTGIADFGLVVGEPFRMWVIEDTHRCAMPAWDRVGALVVDDVRPYEILKMRVLNGIQSNVCQLGLLSDLQFMSEVMGSQTFEAFARRTIIDEVVPGLPQVSGIEVPAYVEQSIRRLKNPDLKHGTLQISTDGSQKIRQRLLEPLRACLTAGRSANGLLLGVAGWMCYAAGLHWQNKPVDVRDPKASVTTEIGLRHGSDPTAFVAEMLKLADIFGTDLVDNEPVKARLAQFVGQLRAAPAIEVVAALI
ncbi:fructuronate reductase [Devosia sp. UYZn731]|uniref:mannitol dehydrogenase family protein n=1 Tax=Devosia sp. UYZn731 TaxID=3156345 RepID=UPI0033908B91